MTDELKKVSEAMEQAVHGATAAPGSRAADIGVYNSAVTLGKEVIDRLGKIARRERDRWYADLIAWRAQQVN